MLSDSQLYSKNPFEVLGIAKAGLKGLTHSQVMDLATTMHRNLVKFYHPDLSNGSPVKFKQVQEAYEILQNEEEFKFWLSDFRSGGKKKKALLEAAITELKAENANLAKRFEEYCNAKPMKAFTCICQPSKMHLAMQGTKSNTFDDNRENDTFHLTAYETGLVTIHALTQIPLTNEGDLDTDMIWAHDDRGNLKSHAWRRGSAIRHFSDTKFIGCISFEQCRNALTSDDQKLLLGQGQSASSNNEYSLLKIQRLIQFIGPGLERGSDLVFTRRIEDERRIFTFLGKIIKILTIEYLNEEA